MNPKAKREDFDSYLDRAYERAKTIFIMVMVPILAIAFLTLINDPNRPKSPAQMREGILIEKNQNNGWARFRDNVGKTIKVATDQPDLVIGQKYTVIRWEGTYRWGHFVSYHFKAT